MFGRILIHFLYYYFLNLFTKFYYLGLFLFSHFLIHNFSSFWVNLKNKKKFGEKKTSKFDDDQTLLCSTPTVTVLVFAQTNMDLTHTI